MKKSLNKVTITLLAIGFIISILLVLSFIFVITVDSYLMYIASVIGLMLLAFLFYSSTNNIIKIGFILEEKVKLNKLAETAWQFEFLNKSWLLSKDIENNTYLLVLEGYTYRRFTNKSFKQVKKALVDILNEYYKEEILASLKLHEKITCVFCNCVIPRDYWELKDKEHIICPDCGNIYTIEKT